MIASGGWDNTVQIFDIRKKGPVKSLFGPHICGEAIDFRNDGFTLLTGSYRQDDVLELWDLRTFKKMKSINWHGPLQNEPLENQLNEKVIYEGNDDSVNLEESKTNIRDEDKPLSSTKNAPFIYAAMFNHRSDTIMAAGAGQNQVRHYDVETGEVLAVITDVPKPVFCMTKANHSNDFAFGSADHKVRIFETRKHFAHGMEQEEEDQA